MAELERIIIPFKPLKGEPPWIGVDILANVKAAQEKTQAATKKA